METCTYCGHPEHRPESDVNYERLPRGLQEGFKSYIENHVLPGAFLTAVLSNNLVEALGHADANNRERIFDIVKWLHNEAPGPCWGSPEKVQAWLAANQSRR